MDKDDSDESSRLLDNERTKSDSNGKSVDIVFDSRMMKTSTQAEDLAATWGGIRSLPDSGRLRRVQSWSGGPPDDGSSEIRILRERLVRTQTMPRPGAVRHLSRRQRLTLASLALVDFMSFCSMSIMAPFFPREASLKGLSDTMCGMVFSFYAVVMFVTSPLFGKFLPKVGAKFLFTAGMFVAGACNVLFGSLVLIEDKTTFTSLCFLVRGLEALGASAYATASYVFVVNAFPDRIGSVLGILETFVGLGMSVGPAIGGLLYSIGGFSLPFYSLGVVMVFTVPINYFLLTDCEEYVYGSKTASIMQLVKIPSIIITGLVIVIMSNTWAFLDPTLEPHLRQFDLSTNQIGLIFLLFSSLYGIFSPIWGWLADRVHNHWCMMVWGLFLSTVGLLLLGPCPYIPGLPGDLWLDLVALSILGMSVALTLLPTFQGVLTSSIYEGGCPEALATYSAVAGLWSCCYSLGEVLGPALGGALSQFYGFPLTATMCAAACFCMAVVTLTFFSLRESSKWVDSIPYTDPTWNSQNFWRNSFFRYFAVVTLTFFSLRESSKWVEPSGSLCDSIPYTDTTWNSQNFCRTRSAPGTRVTDRSPLLTPCSCLSRDGTYGSSPPRHFCLLHNKSNKSGSASVADAIAYFLKFQYMTDMYIKIRRSRLKRKSTRNNEPRKNSDLYQNYLGSETTNTTADKEENLNNNTIPKKSGDNYCDYLDSAIFGSPAVMENVNLDHLVLKRNNSGLMPKLLSCYDDRRPSGEIIRHNLEKVQFYEQSQSCASAVDIFDGCECRDGVTYVKGTITVSSAGACEV